MDNTLIGSRIAGGNPRQGRHSADFYPTPANVTIALLQFLQLPMDSVIWEPACGDGDMIDVFEKAGYKVYGTDIRYGTDYLTAKMPADDISFIITNPPFSLASEFIVTSIQHHVPFALLLKSQFWHARKRYSLFEQYPPTYVLPLTWRPDFLFKQQDKGSPLMDVSWCVWLDTHNEACLYKPLMKPIVLKDV